MLQGPQAFEGHANQNAKSDIQAQSDSDEDIQVQKNAYVSVFSLCHRFKTERWQQRFPPEEPQQ